MDASRGRCVLMWESLTSAGSGVMIIVQIPSKGPPRPYHQIYRTKPGASRFSIEEKGQELPFMEQENRDEFSKCMVIFSL